MKTYNLIKVKWLSLRKYQGCYGTHLESYKIEWNVEVIKENQLTNFTRYQGKTVKSNLSGPEMSERLWSTGKWSSSRLDREHSSWPRTVLGSFSQKPGEVSWSGIMKEYSFVCFMCLGVAFALDGCFGIKWATSQLLETHKVWKST